MRFLNVTLAAFGLAATAAAGTVEGRVSVLGKDGEPLPDVSEALVYIEGVDVRPEPAGAEIRMRDKDFAPRVAAVPVGGTVAFPNDDPILHNAFSVSGENRFDLDLYKRPKVGRHTFRHPGVVRIYCNIHPQMSAFVLVLENPFYTFADASGRFRIQGVPPGRYRLKAWHERAREDAATEIVVPAEGSVAAALEVDASRYRRVRHKNKYGKDYKRDKY